MKFNLFLFLVLFPFVAFSQNQFFGKVIDYQTHKPLAFVNIVYTNDNRGTLSGIDGKFTIPPVRELNFLKFSYMGYQALTVPINENTEFPLVIKLKKKVFHIQEVVVKAGENPAHRIIANVLKNRDLNNPEKLSSFSYTSYNKMVFTLDYDDFIHSDTLYLNSLDSTAQVDSVLIRTEKFIESQYFFMMESVSKREFLFPDRNNEKVVASRVSGLKNASFVLLATQLQSFSFYKEILTINDKNYINPISKGSFRRYFFNIEDTVFTAQNDTVFVISYRPKKGKNFDGLKGVLNINSHGYAIQTVIAEPAEEDETLGIKIQQKYELLQNRHWFPVQLNTEMTFNNLKFASSRSDSLPDGTVKQRYNFTAPMKGIGKSYLRDIQVNPKLNKRNFSSVELTVESDSHKKDAHFWQQYRSDSLDKRELRTYEFMDSLGKEHHFDRKLQIFETVVSGYIPFYFLNIDYRRFIDFNAYEGFKLGLGLETNDKLSRYFSLGGYLNYGFKDKEFKYANWLNINLIPKYDIKLKFLYNNGVEEHAGYHFLEKIPLSSDEAYRYIMLERMDRVEQKAVSMSAHIAYLKFNLSLNQTVRWSNNNYLFNFGTASVPDWRNKFSFTEAAVGLRFAYKEKFMKTMRSKISLGTKYPIFLLNVKRGLPLFDGELAYTKIEAKVYKSFITKSLGKTTLTLTAATADVNLPAGMLYNGHGSYAPFTVNASNSFATMRMSEFLSSRFLAVYFKHDFGHLLYKGKKFRPTLALVQNFTIGDFNRHESHKNLKISTLEKGYWESGLLIANLFRLQFAGYGLGVYYRYGSYSLPKTINNFAFKLYMTIQF